MYRLLFIFCVFYTHTTYADYPKSFSNAKSKAEKEVYFDKHTTFYCACDYVFDDLNDKDGDGNTHETMIHPEQCGYAPRNAITKKGKVNERAHRIEWEHIVPAHVIGGHLDEWQNKQNYPQCKKKNGKYLSGRACAYKVNSTFKKAHDDMNNLTPAVGELNADRSNYAFANITGETRAYGRCDFEVDFKTDTVEPADHVKGNIARTYLYMLFKYNAHITPLQQDLFLQWNAIDPVDEWECLRNTRITQAQGAGNHIVSNLCKTDSYSELTTLKSN